MKQINFKYRCRHCGEVFTNGEMTSTNLRAQVRLQDAIHYLVVENQTPIPMISTHACGDEKGGIADLIGYDTSWIS